jgi:hypothetical protein
LAASGWMKVSHSAGTQSRCVRADIARRAAWFANDAMWPSLRGGPNRGETLTSLVCQGKVEMSPSLAK